MIGFQRLPENEENLERINGVDRSNVMKRDPYYDRREAPDTHGIILWVISPKFPAANQAFSPEELEERIRAHSERVASEMKKLDEELRKHKQRRRYTNSKQNGNRIQDWMRVVNCRDCKRVMISENQPELNDSPYEAVISRRHQALAVCIAIFGTPAEEVVETTLLANNTTHLHRAFLCKKCSEV